MPSPQSGLSFFCLLLAVSLFFIPSAAVSADDSLPARDFLFKTVDQLKKTAEEKKSDLFAPKTFEQAIKNYSKAEKLYQKNKPKQKVQKQIDLAIGDFQHAIEAAETGAVFFNQTMLAQKDAEQGNGRAIDPVKWKKADKKFKSAAGLLENGSMDSANKRAKEAETLYREIELTAIQENMLKETWNLLKRTQKTGVKKYAPVTLRKAEILAAKSASLLESNRYDRKDAAQLAKQAAYEAEHSIYLSRKIKKLQDNDQSFEILLLELEKSLQIIALSLDNPAAFNRGIEPPINQIVSDIDSLKKNNSRLSLELKHKSDELIRLTDKKNYEIEGLTEQNYLLEEQLNRLASTREKLELKIMEQKRYEEKIARINALFSPEEGQTFIEGKNIVIRCYGLNFPSGRSNISPEYFDLLSRLKSAFAEFPNSRITIEGHTDAVGSKEINQKLSEDRARAVRQYFVANSNIAWDKIHAKGFGESRPVASNETVDGQEKNRRIDVLIQIENLSRKGAAKAGD